MFVESAYELPVIEGMLREEGTTFRVLGSQDDICALSLPAPWHLPCLPSKAAVIACGIISSHTVLCHFIPCCACSTAPAMCSTSAMSFLQCLRRPGSKRKSDARCAIIFSNSVLLAGDETEWDEMTAMGSWRKDVGGDRGKRATWGRMSRAGETCERVPFRGQSSHTKDYERGTGCMQHLMPRLPLPLKQLTLDCTAVCYSSPSCRNTGTKL